MRTNFKILADKFSVLSDQNSKEFISFYQNNKHEIENLRDFETDEELYLSVVINHTYGRSLLYEIKDYKSAERHLEISRSLIVNNKIKFDLDLTVDVWYLQTLQHLVKISFHRMTRNKSKELLRELAQIDPENANEYQLEEKEIDRLKRYKIFMILIYGGIALVLCSIGYLYVTSSGIGYLDRVGTVIGLIGIVGSYLNRNSLKDTTDNKIYRP